MPSPGIYKIYAENCYYHIFNRGNNKQPIFKDSQDYKIFFKIFWELIKNPYQNQLNKEPDIIPLCYCMMPNHYHLLVKQTSKSGITNLMKKLIIRYVMYFNKRHEKSGRLFQSAFKAKRIDEDSYFLHLSRYIHLNPKSIWKNTLSQYPYSSYPIYLGQQTNDLLDTNTILSFFKSAQRLSLKDYVSYQSFVEDYDDSEGITLQYQYLG